MAWVPPCVSYMFVTQKSGRVQIILVLTPTLNKNGQGTALCFIHVFDSAIRQSTYNAYIPPHRASTSDFNRIGGTGRTGFTIYFQAKECHVSAHPALQGKGVLEYCFVFCWVISAHYLRNQFSMDTRASAFTQRFTLSHLFKSEKAIELSIDWLIVWLIIFDNFR